MSISSATRKAGPYSGNGSTTQFPFSFKVFSASDVLVVRTDPAGVESNLVLGTDYTVAINADQDANPGGTITATTAPAASYLLTATSQVQNLQPVTLTNQGAFYPKVINDALDRATIQIQQVAEQVGRAVKVQISSAVNPDDLISQLKTDAANAAASASAAASSAAAASANLAAFNGVYYGPYASTPAVDPNGAAPGAGDTYYNTSTKLMMVFDGATWAPSTQHAVLADSATNAANLTGTSTTNIPTSALGSGTADSTTFLRGDRTWAAVQSQKQIQPISASVASNALTLGLNPTSLDFRDISLVNGVPNTRTVSTAISLVVPSGATLGTTSGQAARIVLLAIDNSGTVELAVVNLAGGNNLDETSLISTTAISASANSANVIYSNTARTNVPFRVVGFVASTQNTAGTWATAPTLVQGYGGQAMSAMQSFGFGQTWQNLTGSRTSGVTYYNTTGKPIQVSAWDNVSGNLSGYQTIEITVNGVRAAYTKMYLATEASTVFCSAVVPPGASYIVTISGVYNQLVVTELR